LNYAAFEEIFAKDFEKAKDVFVRAIGVVPHDKFTFSKVWIQYA
jgi:crooked neck